MAQMTQMLAMLQKGTSAVPIVPTVPDQPARAKHKCKNCGKMVFHQDKNCFKLEANKANRPTWYKDG